MRQFRALGVMNDANMATLQSYFDGIRAEWDAARSFNRSLVGRAGSTLEFAGNMIYTQLFFVASFPGIYANVWKRMTEGAQTFVLACACRMQWTWCASWPWWCAPWR